MSLVRVHITQFESQRTARRRARRQTRELWADAAHRRFEDHGIDELESRDRSYAEALGRLDNAFDAAEKLLGPT